MISIIYSDEFLDHDTGIYHPEQAARLTAIVEALKQTEWQSKLTWHLPTPIEIRDEVIPLIKQVHNQDYVDFGLDFNTLEHFKQDLVLHKS